jgi:hypothetical protein
VQGLGTFGGRKRWGIRFKPLGLPTSKVLYEYLRYLTPEKSLYIRLMRTWVYISPFTLVQAFMGTLIARLRLSEVSVFTVASAS